MTVLMLVSYIIIFKSAQLLAAYDYAKVVLAPGRVN